VLRALVAILNFLSALEFRIADKLGEATAIIFHFFLFWMFPIILLYLPSKICTAIGIFIALFYVFVLAGDVFFSVFGHEKLEKKRGMIDITSVHEMREEIIYFSLVTITTVGYGDIQPGLWVSKIFVGSEILFGVGFALLLITMLISVYIDIQRKKKYK
jgi:hypothetical protein